MKKYFRNYYKLSHADFSKLWENCIFILDTSVLTNLYRYSEDVREDFLRLLKKISDRLWIPYQVALEYQENRLNVIAEQVKKFTDVRSILEHAKKDFQSSLEKLQLTNRHPSINPENFIKEFDVLFERFFKDLEKKENEQPKILDDDKIRDEIDSLIGGKIGSPPDAQQQLDDIYREGKLRYENLQPPGYMDKEKNNDKKKKAHFSKGLIFRKEYGDLILWNQIIDEVRKKKHQHVIFVTDDDKEDWWLRLESNGKKTIGPRPELIDEISTKADVKLFYMYNSERFLQYGKTFLNVPVKDKSIDGVREALKAGQLQRFLIRVRGDKSSINDSLKKCFMDGQLISSQFGGDPVADIKIIKFQLAPGASPEEILENFRKTDIEVIDVLEFL